MVHNSRRDGLGPRSALLVYPFNYCMAVLFVIIGLGLVISGFNVEVTAVQRLPTPIVVVWAVFLLMGGPLILAGLTWRGSLQIGHAVEKAGLYLAAGAWSTYCASIFYYAPLSIVPIGQGCAIALACVARAYALNRVDRMVEYIESVANSSERS